MASRGILARLGAPSSSRMRASDMVVEHLRVLLNSRRGESSTVPGFGIPDFSELAHSFPASVGALERAIKAAITEFEPRLDSVMVKQVPTADPLVVQFEVTARLAEDRTPIRMRTQMSAGGTMTVSG